jgi:hypothetical protein
MEHFLLALLDTSVEMVTSVKTKLKNFMMRLGSCEFPSLDFSALR